MARALSGPSSAEPQNKDVKYWLEQIDGAQRAANTWYERSKKVLDKFAERQSETVGNYSKDSAHAVNTLWSNVQTIMPALYAKTPTPNVQRRHRDKDPVGRWGAIVLERALDYQLDAYDFDYSIRQAVQDYLLPGRGQVWLEYKPTIANDGQPNQAIEWECVHAKYVHWKDFLTNESRTWKEVEDGGWVAQRAWLSKPQVEKQFSKDVAEKLTFEESKRDSFSDPNNQGAKIKKASIWEIWDKRSGKVYFVSKNCPELLKPAEEPFLKFEGFFPCPRPIVSTTTSDSSIPIPDYVFYQDQAEEIDMLTRRIGLMVKALRVVGVYDATQGALSRLLENSGTNDMIPVENWAVFAQNKGIDGSVDFLPLDQIIKALQQCYESREAAKQTMYEITGISDIVRGASDPKETLGAQEIKTQWGGLRIRDRQKEVQRFARDILRLASEIITEKFQPQTLMTMSNAPLLTTQQQQQLMARQQFAQQAQQMAQQNPQQAQAIVQSNPQLLQMAKPLTPDEQQQLREPPWEAVLKLLKDEKLRCYRIDIETDSTIQADEAAEKQARTEFVAQFTQALVALGPMAMQAPKFGPLIGEILLFGARGFKTADTLESAIEEAVDALSQQAMAPPAQQAAPPPDPKLEMDKQKMQADQQKQDKDHQLRREEMQHEAQMQQAQGQNEVAKAQASQPQPPQPEHITASLAPMMEIMRQSMEAGQAATAQTIQQAMQQAVAALAAIAGAPKEFHISRDASGRINGGTATPQVTMQ